MNTTTISELETQLASEITRRVELQSERDALALKEKEAKSSLLEGSGKVAELTKASASRGALDEVLVSMNAKIEATQAALDEARADQQREQNLVELAPLADAATRAQHDFLNAYSELANAIESGFETLVSSFDFFAEKRVAFRQNARATGLDAGDILNHLDADTSGVSSLVFGGAVDGFTTDAFTGTTPLEFPSNPQNVVVSRLLAGLINARIQEAQSQTRNARAAHIIHGELSSRQDLGGSIPLPTRALRAQPLPPEPQRAFGPGPLAQAMLDANKGAK